MTSDFPLVGLGAPSDGIPSLSPTSSTTPAATPTSTNPFNSQTVQNAIAGAKKIAGATGNSFLNALFGSSNFQYLTGIIGLILIVAGIFLFRPVRNTVVNVGKTAGRVASKAAEGAAVA